MRRFYWWLPMALLENEGGAGGGEGGAGGGAAGGGAAGGDKGGGAAGGDKGGGAAGGDKGGGAAGGDGGDKGGGAAHWSLSLPEDLRGHDPVKTSKDLADYVKQSINRDALVGRKGLIVPTDKSAPEEVAKFWTDFGVPKEATAYKVPDRPDKVAYSDGDKKFIDSMLPGLHKANLRQDQLDGVVNAYNEQQVAIEGVFKEFATTSTAALEKQHGAEWPKVKAAADAFAKKVWGDNYESMKRMPLPGTGFLLDHPMVVNALGVAGLAMGEDGYGGGSAGGDGDPFKTVEAGQKYVDDLYAEAQTDPKHWLNHPETDAHKQNKAYLTRVQRFIQTKKPAQAG